MVVLKYWKVMERSGALRALRGSAAAWGGGIERSGASRGGAAAWGLGNNEQSDASLALDWWEQVTFSERHSQNRAFGALRRLRGYFCS